MCFNFNCAKNKNGLTFMLVVFLLIIANDILAGPVPDEFISSAVSKQLQNNTSVSDQSEKRLNGTVYDESGKPIPGVSVVVKGTLKGTVSNNDGAFIIDVNSKDTIKVSFVGYIPQEFAVNNRTAIHITLKEETQQIDDVTVVAFAKQKKESVISSIQTVDAGELKVPSSNLTTALAGKMAGIISYQRSGEPGQDNAEFFVRGVTTFGYSKSPLILIDGIEFTATDLARLQPDDIASFSIMKDATATALYGAKGANGVILVTTKEGKEGKVLSLIHI